MTGSRFLALATGGLALACVCLALAAPLDAPALAVAGAAIVFAVLVARELWLWHGRRRGLVLVTGALALVTLVAFTVQRLG